MHAQNVAHQRTGINPSYPDLSTQVRAWVAALPRPREDIQLAVTIIGRRDADQRRVEARWGKDAAADAAWAFDLPCPHLQNEPGDAPISKEVLHRFETELRGWLKTVASYPGYRPDLRNSNLRRTDLSKLTLSGALLTGSRLEGANFSDTRMEGADFFKARMEEANFSEARMEGVNFFRARLEGANLFKARMTGATLFGSKMKGADLSSARMEGTNLSWARLEETHLFEARMELANFARTRMDQATDLDRASLAAARIRSLDWRSVPISQVQVNASFGDGSVELPEQFEWPTHWPKWSLPLVVFQEEYRKWLAAPSNYIPPSPPSARKP